MRALGAAMGNGCGEGTACDAGERCDAAERYSGINVLILWGSAIEQGFQVRAGSRSARLLSLGGHVRKGERGTRHRLC